MSSMIWEVYRQIEKGFTPEDGMCLSNLLEGYECIIRKAIHKDLFLEYATSSKWFWRRDGKTGNPDVYQIVWPGAQQGLFPWDEGCVEDVKDAQPHLWLEN